MSTSASVESYLRRLRQVEARIRPTPRVALPPPELRWNQPVVDRQGRTHWLELEWQPWMGCIGYVMVLLDCIEDAAHGEPRGKSLAELNRELGDLLCAGPKGKDYVPRLMAEAGLYAVH
jgi:hypothetical protein